MPLPTTSYNPAGGLLGRSLSLAQNGTQTTSPSTTSNNLFSNLGIGGNASFGGGQALPTAPAPTASSQPAGGLLSSTYSGTPAPQTPAPKTNQAAAINTAINSSPGTYKGVAITPGNDASVAAQVASIDAGTHPATQPAAPTPPSAPAAPTPPTQPTMYGGLIGSLANQQNSQPNQTANTSESNLQNLGANNPGTSGQAYTDYQTAIDNQNKLKQGIAGQYGNIESEAIPLEFQQGREQVLGRQYASQLDAAQQAVNEKAAALGYQVQGNQAQQSANTSAGNLANTEQSNIQGGLLGAANAAKPETAAYGNTVFNPVTGQYENGGGLPPEVLQQYAQMAASGQYSAIPSTITSNPVLSAQLNDAAKKINPNFNPIASSAQGAATAANIQTSGTAGTSTAAGGYQAAAQNYTTFQGTNKAAEQQAQQVQSILASSGLNQGVPAYNQAINKLSGQLGSTNVANLTTALTELQNMYGQILSVGGTTPTGSESQALSVLNPNASAAQISASIQQLQQAAYNRATGLYSQLQTYNSNLGGGTGNGGGSASGFGWTG